MTQTTLLQSNCALDFSLPKDHQPTPSNVTLLPEGQEITVPPGHVISILSDASFVIGEGEAKPFWYHTHSITQSRLVGPALYAIHSKPQAIERRTLAGSLLSQRLPLLVSMLVMTVGIVATFLLTRKGIDLGPDASDGLVAAAAVLTTFGRILMIAVCFPIFFMGLPLIFDPVRAAMGTIYKPLTETYKFSSSLAQNLGLADTARAATIPYPPAQKP